MITDTCRCGAAVMIKHDYTSGEQKTHNDWLDAHAECRCLAGTVILETDTEQTKEAI